MAEILEKSVDRHNEMSIKESLVPVLVCDECILEIIVELKMRNHSLLSNIAQYFNKCADRLRHDQTLPTLSEEEARSNEKEIDSEICKRYKIYVIAELNEYISKFSITALAMYLAKQAYHLNNGKIVKRVEELRVL